MDELTLGPRKAALVNDTRDGVFILDVLVFADALVVVELALCVVDHKVVDAVDGTLRNVVLNIPLWPLWPGGGVRACGDGGRHDDEEGEELHAEGRGFCMNGKGGRRAGEGVHFIAKHTTAELVSAITCHT